MGEEPMRMAAFGYCEHGRRVAGHTITDTYSERSARAWVSSEPDVRVEPIEGNPLESCGQCLKKEQR